MICPRCKGENIETSTVCSHCKLKLKSVCPRCKSLNKLGQSVCSNCNLKLIRFCPQCKSPNFPNAHNCRKCNYQLLKPKINPQQELPAEQTTPVQKNPQSEPVPQTINLQQEIPAEQITPVQNAPQNEPNPQQIEVITSETSDQKPEQHFSEEKSESTEPELTQQHEKALNNQNIPPKTNVQELSRTEAHETIIKALKSAEQGFILDLSAPDGAGKSTLVSSIIQSLQQENFIWLIGFCQPLNQLLPYSFFQDLFKKLLGLPLFVSNIDESRDALNTLLKTNIGISDPRINNIFNRFLFNDFNECSTNIDINRDEIFNAIKYVIDAINKQANITIIIEDFEYIDSASLACLKNLLKRGFLNKKNFILINHNQSVDLQEQFPLENLKKKILSISLKSMTPDDLNLSLLGMLNNQDVIPAKIKNKIFQYSKDAPLYMEQALWYLFQTGAIVSTETTFSFNPQAENIEMPPDPDELISARIRLISNASPEAIRIIMSASLFGIKFIPSFVQMISQVEEQQFNQLLQMLINNGVFAAVDQFNVRFKHNWIWKVVYEQSFAEEHIIDCGTRLLGLYEKYTTNTSSAILARHAEEAQLKKETYIYYNLASQESFNFGDPSTFTDFQNKIIELLPETGLSDEEKNEYKLNIEEQIGKINYEFNPNIAVSYLSNAIINEEKQNNSVKIIELTGYIARSCEISGNFSGVIECCDKALSLIDSNKYPLETILLNYYKLESTFNLGRFEETIVNATNEVLPKLNKYIANNKTIRGISISELKNIEFEAEITLAKAYVYQGNKQALDLTGSIISKAQKENFTEYELQALFLQALFMTIQGNKNACNETFVVIKEKLETIEAPDKFKLYWYFIVIISNITGGSFKQLKELCNSAIIMANVFNEYNILTLLKLILGRYYEEYGQFKEALNYYDEIVNYCSEKKMATGALFSWYLASNHEAKIGSQERAVEIAERAIEIAQKPNITNYLAEILLHKVIAKVRTSKRDFEGAQINIETAINIAEKNNLLICLVDLYIAFGQVYRQNAAVNFEQRQNSANIANRLYTKALSFAEQIDDHYLISLAEKEISELGYFCKQSGFNLENIS